MSSAGFGDAGYLCVNVTVRAYRHYPRNEDGTNFDEQPLKVPAHDVIVALVTAPGESVRLHSGTALVF